MISEFQVENEIRALDVGYNDPLVVFATGITIEVKNKHELFRNLIG